MENSFLLVKKLKHKIFSRIPFDVQQALVVYLLIFLFQPFLVGCVKDKMILCVYKHSVNFNTLDNYVIIRTKLIC